MKWKVFKLFNKPFEVEMDKEKLDEIVDHHVLNWKYDHSYQLSFQPMAADEKKYIHDEFKKIISL
jgi:hypothetical protein